MTDRAGVLSAATVEALERRLTAFEAETSNQVLVYVEPSLPEGTTLEEYTVAAGRAWAVGQKGRNNGAVLFLFPRSRAARLEVGYGLEGALPDALAGRIVRDEAVPRFARGDWDGGVTAAVEAVVAATKGEYRGTGRPAGRSRPSTRRGVPFSLILFVAFVVLSRLLAGRRRGYWSFGPPGGFGGFGGFGGGGGGGGFSGGGGSFGGGGASGRW